MSQESSAVGVYAHIDQAEETVRKLGEAGFPIPHVSIITRDLGNEKIYIVVRGRGVLFHDVKRDACGPGDFLFVAAATEHQFEDFGDDFLMWRVFYGATGGEVPA